MIREAIVMNNGLNLGLPCEKIVSIKLGRHQDTNMNNKIRLRLGNEGRGGEARLVSAMAGPFFKKSREEHVFSLIP